MDELFSSLSSKTIELVKAGSEYLESLGIPDARAEADILLAYTLGAARAELYLDPEREVDEEKKAKYTELLKKRGDREPLAYLLKTREFMGLDFFVDRSVLIPRPETELLVEKILEIGKNRAESRPARILDLGTGSGSIAVSLAQYWPAAAVVAVDISQEALAVAKKNAALRQVELDFRQGDLFKPVQGEKFDIIVSNPPYVSAEEYTLCSPEVRKEPALALLGGDDGLDFYRRIALQGAEFLLPGGIIILEIGCTQEPAVTQLFIAEGYKTRKFQDYAGLDRIVLAEKE